GNALGSCANAQLMPLPNAQEAQSACPIVQLNNRATPIAVRRLWWHSTIAQSWPSNFSRPLCSVDRGWLLSKPNALDDPALVVSLSLNSSGIYGQGSTTSGQSGELSLGAFTTTAPTYKAAQSNPLSLDTSGNLRTASGTAPVSTMN